ncbi:hypothetical protein CANCADRAFT_13514, partial [Tortispora caseinolytica NRRL Y-17796]
SENRWKPRRQAEAEGEKIEEKTESGLMAPEMVRRKVKGLLNRLTPDNLPGISKLILEIADQSRFEKDGRTLQQILELTFDKACDEPHWSQTYADFCNIMLRNISPEITADGVYDKNGQPVVGGALFRRYLLMRCQQNFEKGCGGTADEIEAAKLEAQKASDEYYRLAAIKRRGLGLVRFIGELYTLGMVSETVVNGCIKQLLGHITNPREEEVESACHLILTAGAPFQSKQPQRMAVYIDRLDKLKDSPELSQKLKFKILDVLEAYEQGW